jgi:hypothetical protein
LLAPQFCYQNFHVVCVHRFSQGARHMATL